MAAPPAAVAAVEVAVAAAPTSTHNLWLTQGASHVGEAPCYQKVFLMPYWTWATMAMLVDVT